MLTYLNIFKFSFLRFLSYPYEIIATVLRTVVEIGFLILFWSLVARGSAHPLKLTEYASYFLIASGVNDLVMAQWGKFGGGLGEAIKTGSINNYLVKPVDILVTFYVTSLGKSAVNKFLSVVFIIFGILLSPPKNSVSIFLFFIFFINAACISYAYNILDSILFFYSPDAKGIRNALNHMIGILSGLMIPITFFPETIKNVLMITPFPWMVFGPTNALRTAEITSRVAADIALVVFWSITLNIIAHFFWKWSIKKYEAVGI